MEDEVLGKDADAQTVVRKPRHGLWIPDAKKDRLLHEDAKKFPMTAREMMIIAWEGFMDVFFVFILPVLAVVGTAGLVYVCQTSAREVGGHPKKPTKKGTVDEAEGSNEMVWRQEYAAAMTQDSKRRDSRLRVESKPEEQKVEDCTESESSSSATGTSPSLSDDLPAESPTNREPTDVPEGCSPETAQTLKVSNSS